MGGTIGKIFKGVWGQKEDVRILQLGFDAAGKTTMLYKLKLGEVTTMVPTIGALVEQVQYKNLHFQAWDLGGRDRIRPLQRHYWKATNAIIWVIDSSDVLRMPEVKDELHKILQLEELATCPILFMANKQDLPSALSVTEVLTSKRCYCFISQVVEKLELNVLNAMERVWHIEPCCATTGDGLYEGLDWLSAAIAGKVEGPKGG
eukprot:TRINITY_DN47136_c0_g1_i2.p1 TRINITY_DN47136_c0_g1~~TRINITY_DN47136_c0_g1_i2.p1  ORF type:complete len:204 (+),score=20.15 TRINITY_DN47136_c0_g1_i2:70-681(+)